VKCRIAVIIPALNESGAIRPLLDGLQAMRQNGHRVIVVDGGSNDGTQGKVATLVDQVIDAPRGRALQMNAGAEYAADCDVLWFVHADSLLPADCEQAIQHSFRAQPGSAWGWFDVRLSGSQRLLRLVEWSMNRRARLTSIATGDQGLFVRRRVFEAIYGFSEIPLMEDIDICRRLKKISPPTRPAGCLVTSSRRWEQQGVLRTIWQMWTLRALFAMGVKPASLAARYYPGMLQDA
jgi:rSAM/selenodomain-associated transferase 2